MKYSITCSATVAAPAAAVWATWADMPAYPTWDDREETTTLDGPFAVGTTGFSKQKGGRDGSTFTLTTVEPNQRWSNEMPLPGGKLVIDHQLTDRHDGTAEVAKIYTAYGPMAVAFRLFFAKGIRREMPGSFAALEREANRRADA